MAETRSPAADTATMMVSNQADTSCCASCGMEEIDDIKLMECDACDLVRYCSITCQKQHKSEHKTACEKRAAELRDELLFKQPEGTHLGDCPICCLPLPLDETKSTIKSCCSKVICEGCTYANKLREKEASLVPSCPFCRKPLSAKEQCHKEMMKRVEVDDPVATCQIGIQHYHEGDYVRAFEYFTRATELGEIGAQYNLSILYRHGHGVEEDFRKEMYHLENAAIGGHPKARHHLGCHELINDNTERAVKHYIIAAILGYDESIDMLKNVFAMGFLDERKLVDALHAHQAAVDARKSSHREAAEELLSKYRSVAHGLTVSDIK